MRPIDAPEPDPPDGLVAVRRFELGGVSWLEATPAAGADVETVADHIARIGAGTRVTTADGALAAALVRRGGRVQRHAHDYVHDLGSVRGTAPDPPPGWALRPPEAVDPQRLAAARAAAYGPGHPDHRPGFDHATFLTEAFGGGIVGPVVPGGSWVAETDGVPRGAIVVVRRPAAAGLPATPWVIDVFVDPAYAGRGAGSALLRQALAAVAAGGHGAVGLVVTDGNPARRRYERLGFELVAGGVNVDLP